MSTRTGRWPLGVAVAAVAATALLAECQSVRQGQGPAAAGSASSSAPARASQTVLAASPPVAPAASPAVLPGTPNIPALVERVNPAVVNITATHEVRAPEARSPFDFFFGPMQPPGRGHENVLRERALGTGFLVDAAGHVVTNAHVVDQANEVRVKLADGREFPARVAGRDPVVDVAVLALQGAKDLPSAALGSSADLRVGAYVVAIGNPFGLGNTVTLGIVSAKGREIGAGPYDDFIQTDASINPGNSGGPLFDLSGRVVGVNTAIAASGQGIGFAIPIDIVREELPQLLATGHATHARLGVVVQPMDEATAKALGLDRPRGALVADVEAGSPAQAAGIKPGDVVVSVDRDEVANSAELPRLIAFRKPGTRVALRVWRDRADKTVEITLGEVPERGNERAGASPGEGASKAGIGIDLADTPQGVIVADVAPGSAGDGKLERGDVVLDVNRNPVRRAADVVAALRKAPPGQPVLFRINRGGATLFVAVERPR